jgi:hypothetical protein
MLLDSRVVVSLVVIDEVALMVRDWFVVFSTLVEVPRAVAVDVVLDEMALPVEDVQAVDVP